ncbi:MAG: metal-dependent transcriptional regulator [Breznakibacter sp.]
MRSSVSVDDFLKHVYLIGKDDQLKVTSSLLASSLQVSSPAVTDMARKLSRKGLVKYEKYQALKLTAQGTARALKLVRRHRLWEAFLYQILGMDLQSIHTEAERLEHQSSDALMERIADYLGQPAIDPHGDPIPGPQGQMPVVAQHKRLCEMVPDEQGVVVRLIYKTAENAMFYDKHSVVLGQTIMVVTRNKPDGSMEVECGGHRFFVGFRQASQIYLERKE